MKALYIVLTLMLLAPWLIPSCVVNNITLTGVSKTPTQQMQGQNLAKKSDNPSVPKAIPVVLVPPATTSLKAAPTSKGSASIKKGPAEVPPSQYLDPKKVLVDLNLSTQTGQLFYEGVLMHTFPFSSGKLGYETPTGTYYIGEKKELHYSTEYHCDMFWAMNLGMLDAKGHNRGIYLHEGRVPVSGYAASHGCPRVGSKDAKGLYAVIPTGSKVYIHGSARDYYEKHFDGYHLLTFDASGKPKIKKNADGSLPKAFIDYVNTGKMEVYNLDRNGKTLKNKNLGVLHFEFMEDPWKEGVTVADYYEARKAYWQ